VVAINERAMIDARKTIEVVTNMAILVVCGLISWNLRTHKTIDLRAIFAEKGEHEEANLEGRTLPPCQVTVGATTRKHSS
jgi:hypothetical protein